MVPKAGSKSQGYRGILVDLGEGEISPAIWHKSVEHDLPLLMQVPPSEVAAATSSEGPCVKFGS
jgi:hypothetical protein